MDHAVAFSSGIVADFCRATKDYNIVHDADYMHTKGKKVIVPGMLLLCRLLSGCWKDFDQNHQPNYFQLYFNSISSENDPIVLACQPHSERPFTWKLEAINGKDCFSSNGNSSMACVKEVGLAAHPLVGIKRSLPVDQSQIHVFNSILNLADQRLLWLLFSIAYASMALQKAIFEPRTLVESEINQLLNKEINPNCVSPFYQSLTIETTNLPDVGEIPTNIDYFIDFEREYLNKSYFAHLQCVVGSQLIFRARYQMIAIPDRLIMRMAKNW